MIVGIVMMMMPMIAFSQDLVDTLPPMATGYEWLSYRGNADIADTGGTRSCGFYMVNRVDSILYLNVHAYGIEVMRFVFTPDSAIYVNKLTSQFYRGTYAPLRLLTKMPVDFPFVQAVFNGHADSLLQHQRFSCEYHDFAAVDSTASFFTTLVLKDLDQLVEIRADLKVVRFNVPGPTSIRIPEKFQELKW